LLTRQEYGVNDLAERVPASASAVSHHLAKLRAIRLVRPGRRATRYTIQRPPRGRSFSPGPGPPGARAPQYAQPTVSRMGANRNR
jgi:hypothetical protein